ncbi:unnamed protein product [Candidula unifasciata]|uniref:CUB domain-containing protein n=1 Tax=Candidula unifasciata TaxID=100452 RepID=A0A8S3Z932_9EUPU|nr:unnamed protein product [Candidula unifasciata]
MSISPARLLARNCCICLLLSLASITTGTVTRTAPTLSAHTESRNKNSTFDNTKGKCQFNLTDSSQSLEVESSTYQHQGFSRCEYIIQAPSSRFILLNFTDIRSQSDMPVETGVLRQQLQQAATITSHTSQSTLTKAPHPVSSVRDNHKHDVNATSSSSYYRDQLLSTLVAHSSGDGVHPESADDNRTDTGSIFTGADSNSSHTRELSPQKTSPEHIEHEQLSKDTDKSNTSFLNKNSNSPGVQNNSYSGLTPSESIDRLDVHTEPAVFTHNCSLQLIIEEVNGTTGSDPQVICWRTLWRKRIPIVFQYSVPIRITYVWDRHSQSGFSLDFSFLRPEAEANCLFRCNNHLCLPKKQLCDGYIDCPDHSDEHNNACALARKHEENDEPHMIKVVVIIIISVIVGVIIILGLVFMISHSHCHDGAHQGGGPLLQPPHSQSSEVCRSPSDSMQDNGQYEALLHHPQRQTTATFAVDTSRCMEQQQFLQQPQQHLDVEQQQHLQYHCRSTQAHSVSRHPHMSQEQLIRSLSFSAECAIPSPGNPQVSRPLQHQQLQQQLIYHQHSELQPQQHRQCKKTHKHASPSVLYPPNIPLSADGEEGYAMSQKALHSKQQLERNWQVQNEVFRPPPNKTVHDRDSPPPPYSLNPPGTKSLDSLVPPVGVVCVLRHARSSLMPEPSASGVPRSHSLSCHQ